MLDQVVMLPEFQPRMYAEPDARSARMGDEDGTSGVPPGRHVLGMNAAPQRYRVVTSGTFANNIANGLRMDAERKPKEHIRSTFPQLKTAGREATSERVGRQVWGARGSNPEPTD